MVVLLFFCNIAEDGCIGSAGVDESIGTGPAYVVESQDDAVNDILTGKVKEGDVVVSLRRSTWRPRNAGNAVSNQLSKTKGLGRHVHW